MRSFRIGRGEQERPNPESSDDFPQGKLKCCLGSRHGRYPGTLGLQRTIHKIILLNNLELTGIFNFLVDLGLDNL